MNNICQHKKKQIHTAKQNNNEIYFNLYYYIRINIKKNYYETSYSSSY